MTLVDRLNNEAVECLMDTPRMERLAALLQEAAREIERLKARENDLIGAYDNLAAMYVPTPLRRRL